MDRVGHFTSSKIHALMSKGRGNFSLENTGKPFDTYIKDKIREYRTGRPINADQRGKAAIWGELMEQWVYDNKLNALDTGLVSKERLKHDYLPWSGAPDTREPGLIGDIKNPWTINSFCDTVDALDEGVERLKIVKPEHYWQLVSNACLAGVNKAELIVHIPYEDEVQAIIDYASEPQNPQSYAFIHWSTIDELPYIQRKRHYVSLNRFKFDVPEEDKELLTARVKLASGLLYESIKRKVN